MHYPIPIQKTKIYNYLDNGNKNTTEWANEILSLPIHPFMTEEQVHLIYTEIKNFYKNKGI